MSGRLVIAGLGPGAEQMITPEVHLALSQATDVVGYQPYVERIPPRAGLTRHGSDNRVETERAYAALDLAARGRQVVVVSSGDPGVFAMAAAVFETLETGPAAWRRLDIQVLPGITAMLAASARWGAPLGHDFCCMNLSDNLKPWALIEQRLRAALQADFAIALYNPRSQARPQGFGQALQILQEVVEAERLILLARAVSTPEEQLRATTLATIDPTWVDMRTLVIIGSSQTRMLMRPDADPWVYTPRFAS